MSCVDQREISERKEGWMKGEPCAEWGNTAAETTTNTATRPREEKEVYFYC